MGAVAGTASDAARVDVVVLSVPWAVIDRALEQAGALAGRIVVDTTNQFGPGGVVDLEGHTAARHNADRMPAARYTKSFNTLTAGFQAEAAGRSGDDRVVQWMAGDDQQAKRTVAGLIDDAGYIPIDLAGIDTCQVMEAPAVPAVLRVVQRIGDGLPQVTGAGKVFHKSRTIKLMAVSP
jgi:8-hydroxy-5-deazaflavin:NADPH oxidoreductase